LNSESKSLASIEGKWTSEIPREDYSSSIQLRTYRLYHEALVNYSLDDIRFMIGQQMGLSYLVPMALGNLSIDIMIEASYYEGDLLQSILILPDGFWIKHMNLLKTTCNILYVQKSKVEKLDLSFEADRRLAKDYYRFIKQYCEPINNINNQR